MDKFTHSMAVPGAKRLRGAKVAVAVQQVGRDHEGRQGKDKVKSSVATLNGFMKMERTNAIWKRLVRSILKGKGGKMDGPYEDEVPLNLRMLRLRYSSGPPADVLPVPFPEAPRLHLWSRDHGSRDILSESISSTWDTLLASGTFIWCSGGSNSNSSETGPDHRCIGELCIGSLIRVEKKKHRLYHTFSIK